MKSGITFEPWRGISCGIDSIFAIRVLGPGRIPLWGPSNEWRTTASDVVRSLTLPPVGSQWLQARKAAKMKNLLTALFALMVMSVSQAQAYNPTTATNQEVVAAIAFTEGVVVECPSDFTANNLSIRFYCVDVGDTSWDAASMRQFSTYGLSGWTVINAWQRDSEGDYSYAVANFPRNEVLVIRYSPRRSILIYAVATVE